MAYNSYVILDEKVAVMDTVDLRFADKWLDNLAAALGGRQVDYLVVHHMEPDHSGSISAFLKIYPNATVVASTMAHIMLKNFTGIDIGDKKQVVTEKSELSLGKHTLTFFTAPMVHWPEVMVSYECADKVLFSADAFGKFGANDVEDEEGWTCEARRYYFGIVGKFGAQVQGLLSKLGGLDIRVICPLHGPVLDENIGYYVDLYNTWSSYGVETEGTLVAYTSVYGNTKKAAEMLADTLKAKGCPKVVLIDLAREDWAENVEDAFRYGKLVLATTTYCGDVFPIMREFIANLVERGFRNRKIGIIENGSWVPTAAKCMKALLAPCENIVWADTTVTIKSALTDANVASLDALADEMK